MLGGVTDTYTYDTNDKLTSTSSKTYGYDLNGNCTSVKVGAANPTLLTYDIENRVTGITYPAGGTNSFVYNGDDLRTKKTDSAGTKAYKTDGSSPASPVLSDGAATYTPGLSERRGTTSSFYHSDALGSTRGITGSTQAATDSTLFDGFGMTVSRTGTTPTPFGFVGKEQYQTDSDSGLQLLGHRYYDPSIGRFLSQDPIQDGSNWYAYADNNPLGETDPSGLAPPKKGGTKPAPTKKHLKPWEKTYSKPDDAARAALRETYSDTGNEQSGWIMPVKGGGFRPTPPQSGTHRGTKSYVPPPNAKGEYHTHPKNNGELLPGPDNVDQYLSDTGGITGIKIPIYIADQMGDIYRHDPRPGHESDRRPPDPALVIQPGHGSGVTKIGKFR